MKKNKNQKVPVDRVEATPDIGLSKEQVDERVKKGHVNIATDPNKKTTGKIIAGNLFTFFNIVLFTIADVHRAFGYRR